MPPVNVDAAHATELGTTYPITVVQDADFGGVGPTYPLWFALTAQPGQTVLGVWAFGALAGYQPRITVYGPNTDADVYLGMVPQPNVPIAMPVIPGDRYLVEVVSAFGPVSPAVLTLSVIEAPHLPVPAGSLLINNESPGFPAILLDRSTGAVLRYLHPFACGESAAQLSSGILCFEDIIQTPNTLQLYDRTFAPIATVTIPIVANAHLAAVPGGTDFLVGSKGLGGTHATLRFVSDAGVLGGTTYDLGAAGIQALAVNAAKTIAYYVVGNGAAQAVKTWDLVGNAAGPTFLAGVADYAMPYDGLQILSDGSILVGQSKTSAVVDYRVQRYSPAGALLNTYPFGTVPIDRIAASRDASALTTFQIWLFPDSITNRYSQIRLSDGAVLETFDITQYNDGVYRGAASATPARFGPSFSCPLIGLALAPTVILSVTPPPVCATWTPQRITITGTDFPDTPVVTVTAPDGREYTPEILSSSSTEIVIEIATALCGEWTVRVGPPPHESPPFTVPTATPCECCMSTKKNLINEALLKIGVSQTIASTQEASREAYTGTILFDKTLQEAYRRYPWDFATRYEEPLTLARGEATWDSALVQPWAATIRYTVGDVVDLAGTVYYCILEHLNVTPPNTTYWDLEAPLIAITGRAGANGDWLYGYLWPDDCIFARRLLREGSGRTFDASPIPFREGRTWSGDPDNDRLLIFTNEPNARLEYTALVECAEHFADPLFEDYLTWLLAAKLAPSLSRVDKLAEKCHAMSERLLNIAATVDAREHQPEPHGEAQWINSR